MSAAHSSSSLVPGGFLLLRIRTLHLSLALGLVWSILAIGPAVAAPGDIGLEGPSYAGAGAEPTGEKPESKTWFADGVWWGSLWDTASARYEIFRLSAAGTWTSTNVALDARANSRADTLWDGTRLYVASHVFSESPSSGFPSHLYRFSYNASTDTYSLDGGFPQLINNVRSESLVIDKDSAGRLWATWVQGSSGSRTVFVNRTLSGDVSWGTPFVLPVSGTQVSNDDISSVIAFGGNKIGVFWSNQDDDTFYFASHQDGAADTTWGSFSAVFPGSGNGDDHMNLKSLHTDGSGRVFAVVKTSLTGSTSPSIVLLVRSAAGTWQVRTIWTRSAMLTRPIVMLDTQNGRIHAFASDEGGGRVYTKTSPIDSVAFPSGLGTVVMQDASHDDINNATSTKQNVSSASGLVVLASNQSTKRYWHHFDALGGGGGPSAPTASFTASPSSGTAPLAVGFTDTSSGAPTSWAWDFTDDGTVDSNAQHPSHTYSSAGSHTARLTVSNAGGSNATTRTITVNPAGGGGTTIAPSDDTYADSSAPTTVKGNASDLRVRTGSKQLHTYLKFTVSGAGAVDGATLRLFVTEASVAGGNLYLVPTNTWTEAGLTWSNKPAPSGGPIDTLGAVAANTWVELDVSSVVTGNGTYSFALINASNDVARYRSSEASSGDPELVLSAP